MLFLVLTQVVVVVTVNSNFYMYVCFVIKTEY